MTAGFFEGCTEQCGWVAGVLAAVLFGSYGAPIKMNVHLEVHPLVMQVRSTLEIRLFRKRIACQHMLFLFICLVLQNNHLVSDLLAGCVTW
jgi:hypothetical protein